jgi:hypothetical protein
MVHNTTWTRPWPWLILFPCHVHESRPLPFLSPPCIPQEAQQDALLSFERVMQSALARDWAADKGRLFGLMAPATAGGDQGAGPLGGLSFGSLTTLPPAGRCLTDAMLCLLVFRPSEMALVVKPKGQPRPHLFVLHCHESCSRMRRHLCSMMLPAAAVALMFVLL